MSNVDRFWLWLCDWWRGSQPSNLSIGNQQQGSLCLWHHLPLDQGVFQQQGSSTGSCEQEAGWAIHGFAVSSFGILSCTCSSTTSFEPSILWAASSTSLATVWAFTTCCHNSCSDVHQRTDEFSRRHLLPRLSSPWTLKLALHWAVQQRRKWWPWSRTRPTRSSPKRHLSHRIPAERSLTTRGILGHRIDGRASTSTASETWRSNAHGSWQHCLVCDLRLAYIPKKGSPSNSTMAVNHSMVDQMLKELEPLMQGKLPTQAICKAMMDKITAETQLRTLVDAAIQELPVHVQGPKPKSKNKAKSGYPEATSSPDSQASWEVMPDMEELLSEEEKNNLANLLRQRRATQQSSMMDASENAADQWRALWPCRDLRLRICLHRALLPWILQQPCQALCSSRALCPWSPSDLNRALWWLHHWLTEWQAMWWRWQPCSLHRWWPWRLRSTWMVVMGSGKLLAQPTVGSPQQPSTMAFPASASTINKATIYTGSKHGFVLHKSARSSSPGRFGFPCHLPGGVGGPRWIITLPSAEKFLKLSGARNVRFWSGPRSSSWTLWPTILILISIGSGHTHVMGGSSSLCWSLKLASTPWNFLGTPAELMAAGTTWRTPTTNFSCENSGPSKPLTKFFIVISVPSVAPGIINMEASKGPKRPEHHIIPTRWWSPLCVTGDVNWYL